MEIKPSIKQSTVLSTFPWMTDFFMAGKSAEVVSDLRYAPFFKVLQEFEHNIEMIIGQDAFNLRRELLVMDAVLAAHLPENVVSTCSKASNLCGVISCYKLVDVLHFLNHPTAPSQGRQPRYSWMPAIGVKGDRTWPMSDWVETLRLGHRRLQALDTKWTSKMNSVGSPSSLPAEVLRTKLFQDLHTLDQQHSGLRMLSNVQVAAIHLFFILHGHKKDDSAQVPLPDIPDTFELNAPLSKEQIWNLTQKLPSQRRYPLRSALLLSPLVLLVDKSLMHHNLSQNQLVQVSKALGNRRPELLLRIEFHMWNTLVSIATGYATAYSAIRAFFLSIPWDDIGDLSQADRDFFKPDATKLDVPISLLSIKAELRSTPCGPSPSASTQVALVADNLGQNHPMKVDDSEDESASFQLKQSSPLTNPPASRIQSTSTNLTRTQEDTPAKNAQSQPMSPPLPKRNLKKRAPQAHFPPSKKPRLTMESSRVKGNPPPIVGSGSHFEPINLLNWKIWTAAELNAYKIAIVPQTKVEFFGSNLPDPTESSLVGSMINESRETATDKKTKQLLQYLDLAMDPKMGQGAVDNFAAELLRGLNYDDNDRIVFIRYPLPFLICGENPIAQADVCLLDDHEILLLLQNSEGSSDPEPQIIAGAIAAFVTNNMRRERRRDLQPRHIVMFPALTMVGTTPTFYKVNVTETMSKAVQTGTYPETETRVFRYSPDLPCKKSEGMRSLLNRIEILRCLEAFKMFVGK